MKETYRTEAGAAHEVVIEASGDGTARVRTGALDLSFTITPLGSGWFMMSDGRRSWRACVDRDGAIRHVTLEGVGQARLERAGSGGRRRDAAAGSLASPMPGTVVKVLVQAGDAVAKGAALVVVEAMKMEIKVEAPVAGTVTTVHKREGEPCDAGETLVEIAAEGGAE